MILTMYIYDIPCVWNFFLNSPYLSEQRWQWKNFFFRMRNLIWTFVFQACRICLINFSPWRIFQNHSDPSHILLGFRFGAFVLECCWLYNFISFYFFWSIFMKICLSLILCYWSLFTSFIFWVGFFAFSPFCIVSFVIFCLLCFPILFHQVIQFWSSMNLSGLF